MVQCDEFSGLQRQKCAFLVFEAVDSIILLNSRGQNKLEVNNTFFHGSINLCHVVQFNVNFSLGWSPSFVLDVRLILLVEALSEMFCIVQKKN